MSYKNLYYGTVFKMFLNYLRVFADMMPHHLQIRHCVSFSYKQGRSPMCPQCYQKNQKINVSMLLPFNLQTFFRFCNSVPSLYSRRIHLRTTPHTELSGLFPSVTIFSLPAFHDRYSLEDYRPVTLCRLSLSLGSCGVFSWWGWGCHLLAASSQVPCDFTLSQCW